MLLAFTHAYSQQDSVRIQQMLDKAGGLEISNPEEAIKIYQQTYDLSIKGKWDTGAFKSIKNIAFVHNDNGRYDLSIEYFQKALRIAEKAITKERLPSFISIPAIHFNTKAITKRLSHFILKAFQYWNR